MHSPPFPSATTKFTPLLIVSNQLYLLNMKTALLQGRLGHLHCMQRNWLTPDKKPQLPNEDSFIIVFMFQMDGSADRQVE